MIICPPESYFGVHKNPYHAKVVVGKYTSVANGTHIIVASHPSLTDNTVSNFPFYEKLKLDYPKCTVGGLITIGNDVWIGENVKIVGECTIGDGAIIGAFSVVAKDIPPYSIVVGNPGKIIRLRFLPVNIDRLLKIKWWDWPVDKIKENIGDFRDVNKFVEKYEHTKG